tara:strand:+ start:1419 stop:2927 length:1509 start_codon:yes stop_codon:yes gene_type:complete
VEQRGRLWLIVGMALVIVALLSNAPGLDTTLLLSVDEDGQAPWGSARTVDPLASDPDSSTSLTQAAWVDPLGLGVFGVRLVGVACLAVLAWTLGNLPRWRDPEAAWSPWLASIALLHPGMLFAVGRGYSEPLGALLGGVMLLTPFHPRLFAMIKPDAGRPSLPFMVLVVSISTAAAAALLALKGLSPWLAGGWAVVLIGWCDPFGLVPAKALAPTQLGLRRGFLVTVALGLLAAGVLGVGSVSDVRGEWWWWTFLPFAVFDVLGLYLLLGAGLWAFFDLDVSGLKSTRGIPGLFGVVGVLIGLLSAYVAALWAVEGQAWDLAWWKTMVVLGNNGRHGMVLLPAAMWLAVQLRGDAPFPTERLHRAFVIVLPLALLAAAHGQTLWTDDAAEAALSHLEEGDDVLLIHDPTLAVHWLYSMHPVLSEQGPEGLVGHWRAPEAGWQEELLNGTELPDRGDLSRVSVIVVAPNLDVTLEGWEEADAGTAPWMNGGGTWRILVPEANP